MATSSRAQMTLNVTNFGARGDAVQFYVNTVGNSVVVTTTNRLSSADIGKAIEVFGAGKVTTFPYCQDMVATIKKVVNGTNIYVSQPAQATLTNTFATYGHNNQENFQKAITACAGATNAIINIPAGKYLFLCSYFYTPAGYCDAAIVLKRGGVHFVGAGMNSTTLLSQGAWTIQNGAAWRGFLFAIATPIKNDFPVSIGNMTLDGGVQQGNTTNKNYPASKTTGAGWDGTHDAVEIIGTSGHAFTQQTWTNVVFTHWRGEMVKSTDTSTNGNLSIFNCVFSDGNATAINIYPSLNISNCVFNNLFQIGEYYQKYSTNTSYLQNSLFTNITGNGFAFNGAVINHRIPLFNVVSNVFYTSGGNCIETTPGQNIIISHNTFIGYGAGLAIALGVAGRQGTAVNSNIVVSFNVFTNVYTVMGIEGTGPNLVENVLVSNNTAWVHNFATGYGWSTNVVFAANTSVGVGGNGGLDSSLLLGQWYLDDISNQFPPFPQVDTIGRTNTITYACGRSHSLWVNATNSVWVIDDTHPQRVPPGAVLQITHTGNFPVSLYLSATLSGPRIVLTTGQTITCKWTNDVWQNVLSASDSFHVQSSGSP